MSILRQGQSQAEVSTSSQERAKVDDPEREDVLQPGNCEGASRRCRGGFEAKLAAHSTSIRRFNTNADV